MPIKTTVRCHVTSVRKPGRWVSPRTQEITHVGRGVEEREPLCSAATMENSMEGGGWVGVGKVGWKTVDICNSVK